MKPGDQFLVSVKGRNEEGYYELSRIKVARPKDWTSLEKAFEQKRTIAGTVTAVVKGGLTVDVGVRAFMPASRSGARDAAEMEKLVGQEIRCRIIKLDTAEEDVVVDRRAVLEEEERAARTPLLGGQRRRHRPRQSAQPDGIRRVRRHRRDGRPAARERYVAGPRQEPCDLFSVGQEVEVRVLQMDPGKQRISLGLKQLPPDPWDNASEKYKTGERVRGTVSRVTEFGAFVELENGVEGLIHLSEMSWVKSLQSRPMS